MVMGRWKLRPEPYKPNPVDADNDGIVQEQTIWERPAGTRFITEAGEAFLGGLDGTDASQLQGLRLVNEKNEPVDYEPSFRKEQISLGETFGTLGSKIGTLQGKPVQPEKVRPSRAPEPRLPISPRELADLRREYPDLFDDEGNLLDRIRDPRNPERYFLGRPVRNELEAINTPDELETYLKGKTIVSFDVETLGKITPEEENDDRIIQLGAVIYRDGEVVARFNKWIAAPWDSVGDWVRNNVKTNDGDPLTQEFLDSQQSTKEVLEEFFAWFRQNTGGGPPVLFLGQNVEFDMLRLRNEVNRTAPVGGFTLDSVNSPYVDTQLLFKNMQRAGVAPDGQSSSLNKLRQFLGIKKDFDHHQADQDAEMTGDVLWALVDFLKVNDPDGSGTRRLLNVPEQNVAEQRSIEEWEAKREQYVKDKADLETVKALLVDVKKNVVDGEDDTPKIPLLGAPESRVEEDEALVRAAEEYTEKIDVESPDFMSNDITPEEKEGLQEQARFIIGLVGKSIGGNRGNPLDQEERLKEVQGKPEKKIRIDFKDEMHDSPINDTGVQLGGYTCTLIEEQEGGYINLVEGSALVNTSEASNPSDGLSAILNVALSEVSENPEKQSDRVLSASGGVSIIHELMHNEEFIGGSYAVYKMDKINRVGEALATFSTKEEAEAFAASQQGSRGISPNRPSFAVLENPVTALSSATLSKQLRFALDDALFTKDANGNLVAKELPTEGYLRPEYKKFVKNYQSFMLYIQEAKQAFSPPSGYDKSEYDVIFERFEEQYFKKFGFIALLGSPNGEKYIQSTSAQNVQGLRVLQAVLSTDAYSAEVTNLMPDDPDLIVRNAVAKHMIGHHLVDRLDDFLANMPTKMRQDMATDEPESLQDMYKLGEYFTILQALPQIMLSSQKSKNDPYNEFFGASELKLIKASFVQGNPLYQDAQDWDGTLDDLLERVDTLLLGLQNSNVNGVRTYVRNQTEAARIFVNDLVRDEFGRKIYRRGPDGDRVLVPAPFFKSSTTFEVLGTETNPFVDVFEERTLNPFEFHQNIPDGAKGLYYDLSKIYLQVSLGQDPSMYGNLNLGDNLAYVHSADYLLLPEEIWARAGTQFVLLASLQRNGIAPDVIDSFSRKHSMRVIAYTNGITDGIEVNANLEKAINEIAEGTDNPQEVASLLRMVAAQSGIYEGIGRASNNFTEFSEVVLPSMTGMLSTNLAEEPTPSVFGSKTTPAFRDARFRGLSFDKRQSYGASVRQQFKPTRRRSSDGSIVEMAQFPSDAQITNEVKKSVQEFIDNYENPPIPLKDETGANIGIVEGDKSDDINRFRQQVINLLAQNNISDDDKVALVNYLRDTFSGDTLPQGQGWTTNFWPEELRGDNFDWAGLADALLKSADRLAEANSKEVIEKRKLEAQDPLVTVAGRVEEIDDMKVRITTSGDNPVERMLNVNRRPERFRWLEVISERFDRNPDVTSVDDRGNETISEANATKLSKKFLEDEGILAALNRAYTAGVTRDERLGELRVALQELDAENANNGKSTNHVADIDSWINVVDDALAIEGGAYRGLGPKALTRAEVEERDAKIRERLGIDPNAEIPKGSTGPVKSEVLKQTIANTGQNQFLVTDTIEEKNDEVKGIIRELGGFWDPDELFDRLPDNFNELNRDKQKQVLTDLGYGTRIETIGHKVTKPEPAVERLEKRLETLNSPIPESQFLIFVTDENNDLIKDPSDPTGYKQIRGGELVDRTTMWGGQEVSHLELLKRLGLYDENDPEKNARKDFLRGAFIINEVKNPLFEPEEGPTFANDETLKDPRFVAMVEMYDSYYDKLLNMTPEEIFEEVTFALDGIVNNDDAEIRVQVADFDKMLDDGFYKNTHFRQINDKGVFSELSSTHSAHDLRSDIEAQHGLPRMVGDGDTEIMSDPDSGFTARTLASPSSGYLSPKNIHEFMDDGGDGSLFARGATEEEKSFQKLSSRADTYGTNMVVLKPELRDRTKLVVGDAANQGGLGTRLEDATPEELFNFYFTNTMSKGHRLNLEANEDSSGGGLNRLIELLAISDAMRSSDETKARVAKSIPIMHLSSWGSINGRHNDITKAGFSQVESDFFQSVTGDPQYYEALTFGNFDMGDIERIEIAKFVPSLGGTREKLVPSFNETKVKSNYSDADKAAIEKRTDLIERFISSGALSEEATEKFRDLKANNPEQYYKVITEFDLGITTLINKSTGGKESIFSFDKEVAKQFYEENGVSVLLGLEPVLPAGDSFEIKDNATLVSNLASTISELMYAQRREEFANKIRALGQDIQIRYMDTSMPDRYNHTNLAMKDILESGKWKTQTGMPEYLKINPEIETSFPDLPVETQWRIIREARALFVLEGLAKEERIFDSSKNPDISDLPAELQTEVKRRLDLLTPEEKARAEAEREARLAEWGGPG